MASVSCPIAKQSLWIAGRWVTDREPLEVRDKYRGDVIDVVAHATNEDIDHAVTSAILGAEIMSKLPAHRRARILQRVAEMLERQTECFARMIAREAGKPIALARDEVKRALDTLSIAAEEAKRIHGETLPLDAVPGGEVYFGFWQRRPIGVIAAITPFNFPLNLVLHKVAPAIASGNAVVLKPAELTPLTAVMLCQLLLEAGLPEQAIQLIHGTGESVGRALVFHRDVNMITFTGSDAVGRQITASAGLRRVLLELGNNSPVVIDKDADLDRAARRCAYGAFAFAGQTCISVQRIYAERGIFDEFLERLIDQAAQCAVGDPMDEVVMVGPMIGEHHAERISSWVMDAEKRGASIHCCGKRDGAMYWPTVLSDVPVDAALSCQEAFAPVVCVHAVDDFEDGLKRAADTKFGLQASVFTRDVDRAIQAGHSLNFGGLVVNDIPGVRFDHMPYGGNRDSGVGREGVRYAMEEMTNIQAVLIRREMEQAS